MWWLVRAGSVARQAPPHGNLGPWAQPASWCLSWPCGSTLGLAWWATLGREHPTRPVGLRVIPCLDREPALSMALGLDLAMQRSWLGLERKQGDGPLLRELAEAAVGYGPHPPATGCHPFELAETLIRLIRS